MSNPLVSRRVAGLLLVGALTAACLNSTTGTPAPSASDAPAATSAPASAPASSAPAPTAAAATASATSGSSGPSASPSVPAKTAVTSSAAPAAPTGSAVGSSAPAPSVNEHAVPALEALLPSTYNGVTLRKTSFDGTALGTDPASRQLENFLSVNSLTLSDFTEAGASDPTAGAGLTFVVFSVQGVDVKLALEAIVAATVAASTGIEIVPVTIAGRSVLKSTDSNGTRFIYLKGNLVYGLQAPTDSAAEQALAVLP